jgi:hypothetical protein
MRSRTPIWGRYIKEIESRTVFRNRLLSKLIIIIIIINIILQFKVNIFREVSWEFLIKNASYVACFLYVCYLQGTYYFLQFDAPPWR